MGLFDIFKRSDSNMQNNQINLNKEQIILQKEEKLNLRKEKFEIILRKNDLDNIIAKVAFVIDKSGSMSRLYKNGFVQETLERIIPIAIKFDDNESLDMWYFSSGFRRLPPVNRSNYAFYVEDEILRKYNEWGSTYYAPVMEDVYKKYAYEEPSDIPAYVIFITDGENFDHEETRQILIESSRKPIFWQFIGIGDEDFRFLKELDNLSGRYIDNANFFSVNDLNRISDDELYNRMMREFSSYIQEIRKLGMIR